MGDAVKFGRWTHKAGVMLSGALLIGALSAPAGAADLAPVYKAPAPVPATSGWEFQATAYGWLTAINGDIGIRNLPSANLDLSIGDVLSHFDGAIMGAFSATNGNWTLLADIVWAQLSADASRPVGSVLPQLSITQRLLVGSGVVGYRLPVGPDNFRLSGTVGFRYQRLTVDSSLSFAGTPIALSDTSVHDWLDPTVGLMLQWKINEKWFLNALGDVGGFGLAASSNLSAQAFASIGYNWTEAWSTAIGYRALYTDYSDQTSPVNNFRYNTTMHGPFMSIAYHF